MKELLMNDYKIYGLYVAIARIFKHFGLISEYRFYGCKVKHYYLKLKSERYHDELIKWLHSLDVYADIDNPKSFNEKIHYLKLMDSTKRKEVLSDKYAVREWIKEKFGEKYLVPIVGVWDNVDDIDFDALPDSFCLKANHGSNMNLIVRDKANLDIKSAKKKLKEWNSYNFGWEGFELQYVHIPRKIIAEEYIEQMDGNLMDYKIHCFHGVPKLIQVIGNRDNTTHSGKEAFYNIEWRRCDLMYHTYEQYREDIEKPIAYDEMIDLAKKMSKDFSYVRVDFYELGGQVKFGEMTFTPANGLGNWSSDEANYEVGSWI